MGIQILCRRRLTYGCSLTTWHRRPLGFLPASATHYDHSKYDASPIGHYRRRRQSERTGQRQGQTVRNTPESDTKLGWHCLSVRLSYLTGTHCLATVSYSTAVDSVNRWYTARKCDVVASIYDIGETPLSFVCFHSRESPLVCNM